MFIAFLVVFFTVAVAGVFGQAGMFGLVSVRLKAGDPAPAVTSIQVLSPPGQSTPQLAGRFTALAFFPDTSHNLQSVSRWNALVEKFAGKPVQFVWITGEYQPPLEPWLAQHPIKGQVLLDPLGATALSYGMEMPAAVIVDAGGRIVGFDRSMLPSAETVDAAIEGRIRTEPLRQDEIEEFIGSRKVLLSAEPPRMPRAEDHKPDFPPSYELHVSASHGESGRGNYGGMDYWKFADLTLKEVISEVYGLYGRNPARIELPTALDTGERYEFSFVLPKPESADQIHRRFQQGLQDHFHLSSARETRLADVYVVSAVDGKKPPPVKSPADENSMGFHAGSSTGSVGFHTEITGIGSLKNFPAAVGLGAIRSVSVQGTADEFCRSLELTLDRPVVNETKLEGAFDFDVEASRSEDNDFLDRLRDRLGLVIAPAQRNVEMLVFRERN
jgi:uncharacterized protein (TIGR03435 family)